MVPRTGAEFCQCPSGDLAPASVPSASLRPTTLWLRAYVHCRSSQGQQCPLSLGGVLLPWGPPHFSFFRSISVQLETSTLTDQASVQFQGIWGLIVLVLIFTCGMFCKYSLPLCSLSFQFILNG